MSYMKKFILKLKFKYRIFKMRFKKSEIKRDDDDKGFIYEDD